MDPLPLRVPAPPTMLLPEAPDQEAAPNPLRLQGQVPQVQGPPHSDHIHALSRQPLSFGLVTSGASEHAQHGQQHQLGNRILVGHKRGGDEAEMCNCLFFFNSITLPNILILPNYITN